MEILAILAVAGTAVCKSITDLGTKSANRFLDDVSLFALQWTVPALILTICLISLHPVLISDPRMMATLVTDRFGMLLGISSVLNIIAGYCYVRAFRHSDVSLVAPLLLLTPILLLGTSRVMLGEEIPPGGIIGVVLTVIGSRAITGSLGSSQPWRAFFRDTGVRLMLVTATIWSVSSNIDKLGVQASSPLIWSTATSTILAVVGITMRCILSHRNLSLMGIARGIIPGISNTGMTLMQMYAITVLPVPYVIALKRFSALITVVGGGLLFGEKIRERLIGTLITLSGVLIIMRQILMQRG